MPHPLSHKCPIPISLLCLASHFICIQIFHLVCQPVLVFPHPTYNTKTTLANLQIEGTVPKILSNNGHCKALRPCSRHYFLPSVAKCTCHPCQLSMIISSHEQPNIAGFLSYLQLLSIAGITHFYLLLLI